MKKSVSVLIRPGHRYPRLNLCRQKGKHPEMKLGQWRCQERSGSHSVHQHANDPQFLFFFFWDPFELWTEEAFLKGGIKQLQKPDLSPTADRDLIVEVNEGHVESQRKWIRGLLYITVLPVCVKAGGLFFYHRTDSLCFPACCKNLWRG